MMRRRAVLQWAGAVVAFSLAAGCVGPAALASPPTLAVYGPGGPAPAMKQVAQAFEKETGIHVEVTAGPTPQWAEAAKKDADIIFSGSENMMTDFVRTFVDRIDTATIRPLYIRPSTILVRPGNPKSIGGIRDLAKGSFRIMVVGGAGQVGMWEDVVGRTGNLSMLAGFRANIVKFAQNSGEALAVWKKDPTIDAWLIWNHWQIAHPDIAQQVPVEPEFTIWRPMDIGLTFRGGKNPQARRFVEYLSSARARAIFEAQGWKN